MIYKFPELTDSPHQQTLEKTRKAAYLAVNNINRDDVAVKRLCGRVYSRQWGVATPAQALLIMACLPESLRGDLPLVGLPSGFTAGELAVHVDKNMTIKEWNLVFQIGNSCKQGHGMERQRHLWVAGWIVNADKINLDILIKECTKGLVRRGGEFVLPLEGIRGLKGFLAAKEIHGSPKLTGRDKDVDPNDSVIDLFGCN